MHSFHNKTLTNGLLGYILHLNFGYLKMPWLEAECEAAASGGWLRVSEPSWRLALLEQALDTATDAITVTVCVKRSSGRRVEHTLFRNRAAVEAHERSQHAGAFDELGKQAPSQSYVDQLMVAEVRLDALTLHPCVAPEEQSGLPAASAPPADESGLIATREASHGFESAAEGVMLKVSCSASVSPVYNPCLRAVLNNSPFGVFVCKPDADLEWTSKYLEADTGITLEQLTGSRWHEMVHPEDIPKAQAAWASALSTGTYPPFEERVRCGPPDDPWRWFACSCKATRDPRTGRVLRWIGMFAAVHERRTLEQKLEAERALFATAVDQLPMSVFVADARTGALTMANQQTYEVWRIEKVASSLADYSRFVAFHADGRRYAPEDWPIARSILRGEVVVKEDTPFQRG